MLVVLSHVDLCELELEYVQRMMAPLLWQEPSRWREGRAVQLGLGAAALTKFCHQVLGRSTTAVELNPSVWIACQQWFALPPNGEGLEVVLQDAASFVADPAQAATVDLLQAAHARVRAGGAMPPGLAVFVREGAPARLLLGG